MLEQIVIFKKSATPISYTYPILLEQIHHICQENQSKTCIIQALIENQNDFQNILKGTPKSSNKAFKKNNVADKHAEDHVINISDRNKFLVLTDNKGNTTNKPSG